jgi:23S rRNA pseudouridine2605 synthase
MAEERPTSDNRPNHRVAKLLARAGVASRREIERMIAEGRVARDGVAIETPATLLASLAGVTVDGQPIDAPGAARLFLFHKPSGVLTTERDPAGRATIYDRLPRDLPRLMPVGRLDLNTEGLLLMTTDGEFKRQLELPSTGVERTYRARAYGNVSQPQLEELIHGIEIDGIRYGPIDANLERRTGANMWIEMTLREGKNREVRRVLEYLGLQVSRLIRVRYGPFILGDLPVGGIGEVRDADIGAFRQTLKNAPAHRPPTADIAVGRTTAARPRPARPATAPSFSGRAGPARAGAPGRAPTPRPAAGPPRGAAASTAPRARTTPPVKRSPATPVPEVAETTPSRPTKLKRQPGWAKPKPKPNAKPRGGPRRGGGK